MRLFLWISNTVVKMMKENLHFVIVLVITVLGRLPSFFRLLFLPNRIAFLKIRLALLFVSEIHIVVTRPIQSAGLTKTPPADAVYVSPSLFWYTNVCILSTSMYIVTNYCWCGWGGHPDHHPWRFQVFPPAVSQDVIIVRHFRIINVENDEN